MWSYTLRKSPSESHDPSENLFHRGCGYNTPQKISSIGDVDIIPLRKSLP